MTEESDGEDPQDIVEHKLQWRSSGKCFHLLNSSLPVIFHVHNNSWLCLPGNYVSLLLKIPLVLLGKLLTCSAVFLLWKACLSHYLCPSCWVVPPLVGSPSSEPLAYVSPLVRSPLFPWCGHEVPHLSPFRGKASSFPL